MLHLFRKIPKLGQHPQAFTLCCTMVSERPRFPKPNLVSERPANSQGHSSAEGGHPKSESERDEGKHYIINK